MKLKAALSVVGAQVVIFSAAMLLFTTFDASAGGDPDCNCSRPRPPGLTCVTACMTNSDWARCATKSWWADSKDRSTRTPRFFAKCGTVCKPYNSPRLGYQAASGNWVVFRFGPNS